MTDVNTDQQSRGLEASLVIDRATASRLGISAAMIDNTLYDAFGQRQVSTMYRQLNQYRVVMTIDPQFWQNPDGLKAIYVRSENGELVPLSAFTHYEPATTALEINHQGQFPAVTISFNLVPGVVLGDAVTAIEQATKEIGLPTTIRGSFQGMAQAFQDSVANQPILLAAALVAVYIVLGILYESFIHPITILSTLPSAGLGALLALKIYNTPLDFISMIGIILLIGIVKKNAIMMIDFALEAERTEGAPLDAIFQACLLRFRPIIMTTMAAALGGSAAGAWHGYRLGVALPAGHYHRRRPDCQPVSHPVPPVVYLYLDRFQIWCTRLHRGATGQGSRSSRGLGST